MFESYGHSLDNLDTTFDEMQDLLRDGKEGKATDMDEAMRILFQAELDVEQLTDHGFHNVHSVFSWDPSERLEKVNASPNMSEVQKLATERNEQATISQEMVAHLELLEQSQERMLSLREGFGELGLNMENQKNHSALSDRRQESMKTLQNQVMPRLDRTLEQIESTTETFEHELDRRRPILERMSKDLFSLMLALGAPPFVPPPPPAAAPADPAAAGDAAAAAAAAAAAQAATTAQTAAAAAAQAATTAQTAAAATTQAAATAQAAAAATAQTAATAQAATAQTAATTQAAAATTQVAATAQTAASAGAQSSSASAGAQDRGRKDERFGGHEEKDTLEASQDLDRGRSDEREKVAAKKTTKKVAAKKTTKKKSAKKTTKKAAAKKKSAKKTTKKKTKK